MTDKTVAIRVQLPAALRARFKAHCALQGRSMNQVVVTLIEQWLAEQSPGASASPGKDPLPPTTD